MSCCSGVPLMKKMDILEDASPLGAYLSPEELERLAGLCTVASFGAGQSLPESPFYCIYYGEVQVRDDDDNVLCTKHPGAFFTRRAGLVRGKSSRSTGLGRSLRSPGSPSSSPAKEEDVARVQRTSIVKDFDELDGGEVDDDVAPKTRLIGLKAGKVLFITSEGLEKFLLVCKPESGEVVRSITRTNIGTQLSMVPFIDACPDLEPADLRALGEICSYRTFGASETIFAQGDRAENFYIILKGAAEITVDVRKLRGVGETVASVTRSVGESFGVAALVYNAAERKYSATATERTLCLVIGKDNFGKFLSQKPSLESTLMLGTKTFLLERYAAMKLPIFAELSAEQLASAAALARFAAKNLTRKIY